MAILASSNPQIISQIKDLFKKKIKKAQFKDISCTTKRTMGMYLHPGQQFGSMLSNHSLNPLKCIYSLPTILYL